ncbi:14822_t:CDS:2, partial [Gigaspora rosea]
MPWLYRGYAVVMPWYAVVMHYFVVVMPYFVVVLALSSSQSKFVSSEDYPKVWVSELHLHDMKFGALDAMALDTRTPR